MAALWPGAVRSFTTKHDVTDVVLADNVNLLQDEVTALERFLGVNPHGTFADVVSRLNSVDTSLSGKSSTSHTHTGYQAAGSYVKTDGTTPMTGLLVLPAQDPTSANQAVRKQYVDVQIKALAVDLFAVGSSLVGGSPPTSGALITGDTVVRVLNSSNEATINFPGAFPNGVITVVVNNGDKNTGDDLLFSTSTTTKSSFIVHARNAGGTSLNGVNIRCNYVALGW